MTDKYFEFITDKIGIWFANLKLKSFRHTFDGDTYPSSALVTDYELFIAKLKKDIEFIPEEPVSEDLEEASGEYTSKVLERTNVLIGNLPVGEEIEAAFIAGAQWQKKKTINKVVDYLKKNWYQMLMYDINDFGASEFNMDKTIERFVKAIED